MSLFLGAVCFLFLGMAAKPARGWAFSLSPGDRAVVSHCNEYVSLRESNSTSASVNIRIPLGEEVTILEMVSGGFAKVQYFDRSGYVMTDYLEPWEDTLYHPRTETVSGHSVYCGNYGTAKYIDGRTVVVAIFADDAGTSWNFQNNADAKMRLRNRFNLSIACTWLTEQSKRWGASPGGFVWDWRTFDDLYYTHSFEEDIVHGADQDYSAVRAALNSYIHNYIPTEQLLDKYNADNIIYNVYLNAPNSEDYRSWTTAVLYYEVEADKYSPEICVIVPYGRGRENTPAVLAHEMLHCFGAYDLYQTNSSSPITQEYVDYLTSHQPNDLMNHCYFSDYDIITNEFSAVDAYYVGLISDCKDVQKWGLGESLFERFSPN